MSKSRNLIILLVLLALLGGSYAYVSTRPKKSDTDVKVSQKIELSKLDVKKIVKMNLSSSYEDLTFEKKGDSWILSSNPVLKLNQDQVNALAGSFANLNADKAVTEDSKELENFGLKLPVVTVSATLDSGSETVIYLGNKTPQGNAYYLMVKGNPKVYTVSSEDGSHFSYTLADVRDRSVSSLNSKEANYIKIVNKDGRIIELKMTEKGSKEELQYGSAVWLMLKPYSSILLADDTRVTEMTNGLGDMKIDSFVDSNPSDYAKYGLDKPVLDLTAKDKNGTMHLSFGKDKDEKSIYFKVEGSKEVYAMSKSALDPYNAAPFDVVSKNVYIANSENIDQVIIEGLGQKNVLAVTRTTKPASKPDEKDTVEYKFKLNNKDIEDADFYTSFNGLMGLSVEAENDRKVAENPEVKVTFVLNKPDNKQVVINYCPYNNDFYAVFKDGKSDFLISKQQVKNVLDVIQKLASK